MSDSAQWSSWLRVENLLIFIAAAAAYHIGDYRWWVFFALFLIPDLSMLGYFAGRRVGAVAYNITHAYLGPAGLLIYAMTTGKHDLYPFGVIWIAHIAADRALGYGLKSVSGFRHTHLGYVGKRPAT